MINPIDDAANPSELGHDEGGHSVGADLKRVSFGTIFAHAVTMQEAVDLIVARASSGLGGYVVTPNVDHICQCETNERFRDACSRAFLAVPDGKPLLWMAQARKTPLPEKVSGSDLVVPLLQKAAVAGLRVFFIGATEAVCNSAAFELRKCIPNLQIVGWTSPVFDCDQPRNNMTETFSRLGEVKPDLVLVAFGAPKQEYFMSELSDAYAPAVALGIGATLDFLAGTIVRSPKWWSDHGLEWLFRLAIEPKRLWRRYLLRDSRIFAIFVRDLRKSRR